jgi:hypothetical protein
MEIDWRNEPEDPAIIKARNTPGKLKYKIRMSRTVIDVDGRMFSFHFDQNGKMYYRYIASTMITNND